MRERMKLVLAYAAGKTTMAELCRSQGVSRKTAYKWWRRYCEAGVQALKDRASRPHSSPNQVSDDVEAAIVELRQMYPSWGPKKLKAVLERTHPSLVVPAPSTIGEVLRRNGLRLQRRRKRRGVPATSPFAAYAEPNAVWCADFKGHFGVGGKRCHPLTIIDGYSRYLIACKALSNTRAATVRKVFFRAFKTFGVPKVIRTDNGPPFASTGAGGLTELSTWWIKLGIVPERIEPGHPEQNGRQERFHRTLQQETVMPPCASMAAQDRRFLRHRQTYNEVRPHEALGQVPPASFYSRSSRPLAERWLDPRYPDSYEVHRTTREGWITWRGHRLQLNSCLDRESVGVRRLGRRTFEVFFGPTSLGCFREPRGNTKTIRLITPSRVRRQRDPSQQVLPRSPVQSVTEVSG